MGYYAHPDFQPLDCNPHLAKLVEAFPVGRKFRLDEACVLLGWHRNKASKFLHLVARTLENCPEAVQLVIRRGPLRFSGGHWFAESSE